jgi:ABC-2 type transport system ATP-binding protein
VSVLRVSALTKGFPIGTFGRRRSSVLRDVNLELVPHDVCALLGDNGAGKTTLLRLIAGVLTPDSGEIHVVGRDIRSDSSARALVGFASGDDRSFQLRLSGLDNLRFFATLFGLTRGAAARRIAELGAALDLDPFIRVPVGQCSAGMRGRLGMARALLHEPKLLLLDEPTKSIDESHLPAIHALIREHAENGGAALVVTHSSDEALAVSSRIERLDSGRLALLPPMDSRGGPTIQLETTA